MAEALIVLFVVAGVASVGSAIAGVLSRINHWAIRVAGPVEQPPAVDRLNRLLVEVRDCGLLSPEKKESGA